MRMFRHYQSLIYLSNLLCLKANHPTSIPYNEIHPYVETPVGSFYDDDILIDHSDIHFISSMPPCVYSMTTDVELCTVRITPINVRG